MHYSIIQCCVKGAVVTVLGLEEKNVTTSFSGEWWRLLAPGQYCVRYLMSILLCIVLADYNTVSGTHRPKFCVKYSPITLLCRVLTKKRNVSNTH